MYYRSNYVIIYVCIYIQYSGIYIDYSYYSYEYTVSKHVDIF